jgi:hypothetical protein
MPSDDYNYTHYGRGQIVDELRLVLRWPPVRPGQPAPDFDLPAVGDGRMRLAELRGRPVLVHFGSYT